VGKFSLEVVVADIHRRESLVVRERGRELAKDIFPDRLTVEDLLNRFVVRTVLTLK
jgi:hypothetical protein